MLFNSFSFLASFGALVFVYYALSHRFRWILLLAASLLFYASFGASHVVILVALCVVAYCGGRAIHAATARRTQQALLTASIVVVLAPLFINKYFGFFVSALTTFVGGVGPMAPDSPLRPTGLAAVVGLSFYTFSCISYLADVYARRMEPERHAGYFALYIAFFPKLLAGPIERARPFLEAVRRPVVFSDSGVTLGLQLMLWGLFKKVVIADRLAPFVDKAYGSAAFAPPVDLLIATYFFAFQLYCDFSGYSDMAIGAAKVLGFDLMVNFRRPYLSTSVADFWSHRWHLSLTSWFRDYVYIPLGGNRVSPLRQSRNVMAVFLLSGLWHGANWTFVIWGAVNGCYYVVSTMMRRMRERRGAAALPPSIGGALGGLLTFHLILITWVFFRAASVSDAVTILSRIGASLMRMPALLVARVSTGEMLVSLVLIVVLLGIEGLDERRPFGQRLTASPLPVRWAAYYGLLLCLIVLGAWNVQQFVYMQF